MSSERVDRTAPSEPTVFIVDDDEACRDSIRALVVAVGLATAVFSSAFEFLATLQLA